MRRTFGRTKLVGDDGFTLIELLVVVVIIGILIAIAIPLYLNYEKGAADKSAQSDVRGAVSALELCRSANGSFPTTASVAKVGTTNSYTGCANQPINVSSGTTLTYLANPAGTPAGSTAASSYDVEATNSGGSGAIYCYSSVAGGSVTKATSSTVLTTYATACN